MEFIKYTHLERFGTDEVDGINVGRCHIFPKLDGTNASFWFDGEIRCGSRNRVLNVHDDNAGFTNWLIKQENHVKLAMAHPELVFYGEWLCLSGDTKIKLVSGGKRGHTMTLKEMYEYQETPIIEKSRWIKKDGTVSDNERPSQWVRNGYPQTYSLFIDEDSIRPQRIAKIIKTGVKKVFRVRTRKDYEIKSTGEHRFFTPSGWLALSDLQPGDVVAVTELYNHRIKRRYGKGSRKITDMFAELRGSRKCENCDSPSCLEVHHKDEDWQNNDPSNLQVLCRDCHKTCHKNVTMTGLEFDYEFDKIVSIEDAGEEECYDISMGAPENSSSFVADGFVVHNCPHTLRTYQDDAWRDLYIFDVYNRDKGIYLSYDVYKPLLDAYSVTYIPCLGVVTNPTYEILCKYRDENFYKVKDNSGAGEGIVIKQYNWKNKFGRTSFAKMIANHFQDAHIKVMGGSVIKVKLIEEEIANVYVTKHIVDKAVAKIRTEQGQFSAKNIPQLFGMVFHELIVEEMWEIVKKHKYPKIDFKTLNTCTIVKIKQLLPELFGN